MEFFHRHFLIDLMNLLCLRDEKLNKNQWKNERQLLY